MDADVREAEEKYDFVRFTFVDIHGIGRCKTVSRSSFEKYFKNGPGFYVGVLGLGLRGEVGNVYSVTGQQKASNYQPYGNIVARPEPGSLHPLPTLGDGKYRVGEVLCDTHHYITGARQEENPRYLAKKQLDRLASLGYELYSSFELEFILVHPDTLKPVFDNISNFLSCRNESRFDPVLLDIVGNLEKIGVEVETLLTEYGEGQFEIALKPQTGMKILDNTFIAKNCIAEVAEKHNLKAVFMAKYAPLTSGNGLHFNHSLRATKGGATIYGFSDESDELKLSETCRCWLGGLTRHFRALNAICCPTVNCYRRVAKPWTPSKSDWGIDNRMAAYRVKNASPEETYVESRLASTSANPYLVLAVTVAAGIDGIEKKLPCPIPNSLAAVNDGAYTGMEPTKIPLSLGEALKALEQDECMVNALGTDFVKWFVILKEDEMTRLSGCDVSKDDPEMYAKERDLYLDMI